MTVRMGGRRGHLRTWITLPTPYCLFVGRGTSSCLLGPSHLGWANPYRLGLEGLDGSLGLPPDSRISHAIALDPVLVRILRATLQSIICSNVLFSEVDWSEGTPVWGVGLDILHSFS